MEPRRTHDKDYYQEVLPNLAIFDGINASDIATFKMKVPFVQVKNGKGYKISFHNTADVCFRLSGITVENSFKDIENKVNVLSKTLSDFLEGDPNDDGIINRLSEILNLISDSSGSSEPILTHLQTQITELKGALNQLITRVGTTETNITNLINSRTQQDNKIADIQSSVNTLQPQINTNKTNIASLNTKLTSFENKFNAVDFSTFVTTNTDQDIYGKKKFFDLHTTLLHAFGIEFDEGGDWANNGGYINFHYNGSPSEFTSRIIEAEHGKLRFGTPDLMCDMFGVAESRIDNPITQAGDPNTSDRSNYILFTNKLLIQWGIANYDYNLKYTYIYLPKPYYSVQSYTPIATTRNYSPQMSIPHGGLMDIKPVNASTMITYQISGGNCYWFTVGLSA